MSFCLPSPGTPEFNVLLLQVRGCGLPFVGPSWGPRLPQIRPSKPHAPGLAALDGDAIEVRELTSFDAQPWFHKATHSANGVDESNRDEILSQIDAWEREHASRQRPPVKPLSRPSLCMQASYWWHLGAFDDRAEPTPEVRIRDTPLVARLASVREDALGRFRALPDVLARGDEQWSDLGAWPYPPYPVGDIGYLPEKWWTHGEAATALDDAIAVHIEELSRRDRWAHGVRRKLATHS